MGLLDYFRTAKENYDRIREETKKRSLLSQLGRAASAIVPDSIEQKVTQTLSPIFSGARDSARQAAINAASSLPAIGPVIGAARAYRAIPQATRNEISQDVGATAKLGGAVGVGLVKGVGEFGATQMDRLLGTRGQSPLQLGAIASDVARLPRDYIVQPTARAATGLATSGISRLAGIETPESIPAPKSALGQFFLGQEPIKSIKGIATSAPGVAESLGYGPGFAKGAAPFIGVGLMASDLFPFSPKKAAGKIAKEVAEDATKKTAKEAVESLAEAEAKKVAAELLTPTGPSKAQLPKQPTGKILGPAQESTKFPEGVSSFYNTETLNIPQAGRDAIQSEVKNMGAKMSSVVGKTLSHREVIKMADETATLMPEIITRDMTKAKEAANLNLRRAIAEAGKDGKVTDDLIQLILTDKSIAEDAARVLNARKIKASPRESSLISVLLDGIYKVNKNSDDILDAAKGVDFNDPLQAAEFYRKFVKPSAEEWIDALRYNSMLSSPTTHMGNIVSNIFQTGVVAPVEKTVTGMIDATKVALMGGERKYAVGEGAAYAKGYYSNLADASRKFVDTIRGKSIVTNPDILSIPMHLGGIKGKIERGLKLPMKLLEAADQFATALTEAGVKSSLELRSLKGIEVGNIAEEASSEAAKRLFRSKIGATDEGIVLGAIEFIPKMLQDARYHTNPVVKWTARLSFPFINTPTQLFKQGVEYSPLGVATLLKHPQKIEQLSKIAIGTTTALGIATLAATDRLTWGEPTGSDQRNAFRNAGLLPYSVKIGDRWYQYSRLPPVIAWNFALVAAIKDSIANRGLKDSDAETIGQVAGKYLNFFADQSYMKQVGEIVAATKGDESAVTRFLSNIPQQFIPYRAYMSWIERAVDPVQRQADPDGTVLEKQLQTMMAQVPGLATLVPPRLGPEGQPIENQQMGTNSLFPFRVSTEQPEGKKTYENILDLLKRSKDQTAISTDLRERAEAMVKEFETTDPSTRAAKLTELKTSDPALAEKFSDIMSEKALGLTYVDKKIKALNIGNGERAKYVFEQLQKMEPEKRAGYWDEMVKKKLISDKVAEQLQWLLRKQQP